jgi:methyl-accepting chemotaxis protein
MDRTWTFGRTISVGFAAVVALTLVMAVIALAGLHHVVQRKDEVIDTDTRLVLDVQKLLTIRDARAAANRGYLLSGQPKYLDEQYRNDDRFDAQINEIRALVDTARGRQLVDQIAVLQSRFVQLDKIPVRLRQSEASAEAVTQSWDGIDTQRLATTSAMNMLYDYQQSLVAARKQRASRAATFDIRLIIVVTVLIVLAAAALAFAMTRRLRSRIGATVADVQTSSAQLQSTAGQQALGAREQATTVNEISTTTTELLSSSRQIAESAQRVADLAERTAEAGLAGRSTVVSAQESMTEIRRQVDAIVNHMVDLGGKSQRIGVVLDIVSELAEQTNILAINSTIEAAGAGEYGRRFAIVADEIRKLADRVTESTKEIRDLIDGTRTAVNTTVMATETGSKAVDAGSALVEQVATSFEQIVDWVTTSIEAAREIELSTKQQTIAVEQVNLAVANVAETTRETESSSDQTLETAGHLQRLSTKLRELVETAPGT